MAICIFFPVSFLALSSYLCLNLTFLPQISLCCPSVHHNFPQSALGLLCTSCLVNFSPLSSHVENESKETIFPHSLLWNPSSGDKIFLYLEVCLFSVCLLSVCLCCILLWMHWFCLVQPQGLLFLINVPTEMQEPSSLATLFVSDSVSYPQPLSQPLPYFLNKIVTLHFVSSNL